MSRTNEQLRGIRGQARRDYYAQVNDQFESFVAGDEKLLAEDSGWLTREVSKEADLAENDLEALDAMLNSYTVPQILAALARLCESRNGETDEVGLSFDDFVDGEVWQRRARALILASRDIT